MIFLLCFMGFLLHCKNIFESIINSDLSQDAYYLKNDSIHFPDLVLCVKDFADDKEKAEKLDEHHKLTGNYLNQVTPKLEDRIQKIRYLNTSDGKYVDFDQFASRNELFRLKAFLYQDIKCFEISPNLVYQEEDLFFQEDPYVLKVYLSRLQSHTQVEDPRLIIYFLTKKRGTKQFNQIYKFQTLCFIGNLFLISHRFR